MFTQLINTNQKMPDPRAGSTPLISGTSPPNPHLEPRTLTSKRSYTAYSAACLASQNVTLPVQSLKLALPASWDGPFDVVMGLPGTIVTVIVGAGLGMSAILLLSNM